MDGVLRSFVDLWTVSFPRGRAPTPTSGLYVARMSVRRLKLYDEARAGTAGLLVGKRAAERFDERSRDRETEAGAFPRMRVERARERLKQIRPQVGWDALTIVGDHELQEAGDVVRLDGNIRTSVPERVRQQVRQHLV